MKTMGNRPSDIARKGPQNFLNGLRITQFQDPKTTLADLIVHILLLSLSFLLGCDFICFDHVYENLWYISPK